MTSKAKSNRDADGQDERIARQNLLRERLSDLLEADPDALAADLANLSLSIFAQRFPAKLSAKEVRMVKENYSSATEALIAERAMAQDGVLCALALAVQMGRIAIDYFPESNVAPALASDAEVGEAVTSTLVPKLQAAFKQAVADGLSPFGVGTMMILMGAVLGVKSGVKWPAMIRPLLDCTEQMMKQASMMPAKDREEAAIKMVMAQMGISRAEAKRYAAFAAKQIQESGRENE